MSRRPATPESSVNNMLEGLRREGMLTERSIEFYGEQAKICLTDLQHLQRNLEPWNVTIDDAKSLLDYWTSKELAVSTKRGYLAALRTWTAYYGNFEFGLRFEELNAGELQSSGRITPSAGDIAHTPTQSGIKLFT